MSFSDNYLKLRKKKEEEDIAPVKGKSSYTEEEIDSIIKQISKQNIRASTPITQVDPKASKAVQTQLNLATDQAIEKQAKEENKWFKSGAFSDGYQKWDLLKSVGATLGDVGLGIVKGAGRSIEGVADLALYYGASKAKAKGYDDLSNSINALGQINVVDEVTKEADLTLNENSFLGNKTEGIEEGIGQIAMILLTGNAASGAAGAAGASAAGMQAASTAATTGLTGLSSMGSGMSEAYEGGAADEEARKYGTIKGAIDAGTELISGGLGKGATAIGVSKGIGGIDDILARKFTSKISNIYVKNAAQLGIKATGEGLEEVAAGYLTAHAKKGTYMSEEEFSQILEDEKLMEQFVVGALTSSIAQSGAIPGMQKGSLIDSYKNKTDFITGLTQNETAVVEKEVEKRVAEKEKDGKKLTQKEKNKIYDQVVEDLDKGGISIDTIEEVLGSQAESYKSYTDLVNNEDSILKEYDELGKKQGATLAEQSRFLDLHGQVKDIKENSQRNQLKSQLSKEVFGIAKDSKLVNSYIEDANKHTAFKADVNQYKSEAAKQTVQNAINAGQEGLIHNGRDAHSFVDLAIKMSEDKDYVVEFHTSESIAKLKADPNDIYGLNKQNVDPNKVRAFVSEGQKKIIVNMDAGKSLNSLVGHEITDTLREAKLYDSLQKFAFEYAETKGELESRRKSVEDRYAKIKADIDGELTSDIVGDYLFTDEDFIRNLSTKDRNLAQRIYDEVKYLIKLATAGSKEKRKLETLKHTFEKVWRENATAQGDTKFSVDDENSIDNYSQAHYNRFGWAREAEAVTFKELNDLQSKLHNKNEIKGKTPYGEAIYEINNNPETGESVNNVIAFTKGKADNFTITRVVRIFAYDQETVDIYREVIYANTVDRALENAAEIMGNEVLRYYSRYNSPSYREYTESKRSQRSGSESEGNTLADGNGNQRSGTLEQTQSNEIAPTKVSSKDDAFFDGKKTKFSLSDSDGKKLTNEQNEYFKDSKMRDDNGNLKVMYHGSQDAGFHIFDSAMSDDDTSFFFVDRNDVAASYSGTSETYEAQTIRTAEDMNNFLAKIGYDNYEAVERDGKFELLENNEHVAYSDTAQGLYDEFCWYEGVGEGDANYKVYLNLKNPLVIDAKGRPWNKIDAEFSQEVYDRYESLTAEEKAALTDLAEWEDFGLFNREIQEAEGNELASAYAKMGEDCNIYDLFSVAADSFSEDSMRENSRRYLKTRDFAQRAKEGGYDGVIFKDIVDNGGYSNGDEGASTVAIAFESEQIKSVANKKPTGDPDIRFSLSEDSEGRELSPAVKNRFGNSKVVDENGSLKVVYHGTAAGEFSIFDKSKGSVEGDFGSGFYFTDNEYDVSNNYEGGGPDFDNKVSRRAEQIYNEALDDDSEITYSEAERLAKKELYKGSHKFEVYLNIENPAIVGETILFDPDSYYSEYNQEDYDSEDDYYGDVEQLVTDDIDGIIWDIENNVDIYSMDGIADVLWEAFNEGGFDLEKLKKKLNSLYLEDSNGNLVANEVTRQIVESLGYDGIIDPTVSNKWNMDMESGTTHYIVFKPNQIKAVTNENPTDNPDIHRSLSDVNVSEETPKKYGSWNVSARDLRVIGAPVREDLSGATETVTADENTAPTQNAVQSEFEGVADTSLEAQFDALERQIIEAHKAGDTEKARRLAQQLNEIGRQIDAERKSAKTENVTPDGFAPMTESEADSLRSESFRSLEDADAPPEMEAPYYGENERTAITLDRETAKKITSEVNTVLGLDDADSARMTEVIENYARDKNLTESDLFDEIQRNFEYSEEVESGEDELKLAQNHMKRTKIYVPERLKAEFNGKRKDGFGAFKNEHFGHFYLTTNENAGALKIDVLYGELNELYPNLFPDDILSTADQLLRMGEVASAAQNNTEAYSMPYDDDTVNEAVRIISEGINRYSEGETLRLVNEEASDYLDSVGAGFAPVAESAPRIEKEAAPSYETAKKSEVEGQQTMFREPETKAEQPIKTVKDRIQHKLNSAYGELSHNKRLRRESIESFNAKIAELQLTYDNKKNKDTKVANDILRRIERLTRMRDEIDADYTKRMNDNRKKVDKYKSLLEEGYSDEEGRMMRSELHAQKVDEIKNAFSENGLDLDETLKDAKDLSTFSTVDNTPQRVMEKSLGYKGGQVLADATVNKVAQNESEGIKWLNSITSRDGEGGLLKQLSKKYHIKPGTKESAAAQMYAEGFYVDENNKTIKYGDAELAKDFPNAETQKNIKGLAKDPRIRQFYDDTLAMINESRTRNAYPEIKPLDNYFLHFRAMDDTFSRMGIPFNPNDIKAKDLPTDLNGVTADLKPGQPYFASAMHRRGKKTSYDLLGGMERYATGAKNQIYHIDDIQTLRALRNYIADTYGQANGLDNLDNLSEEEVQDRIKQVYNSHLSTFAKFLNEEANVIAGKTALIDRGLEGIIGRRGMQFFSTINQQVGSNMVGGNVSSAGTNFLPVVQAFAKTNKTAFVKGFAQTVANKVGHVFGKADSFADNPTAIRRKGADRFYRTPWQKTADAGYALMSAVDNISTEVIVRAKYNEFIKKGMSEQQAILEADKWTSRLMGDRSLGQMPQLYNSKMLGLITKFQLEVRNQLDSQFYDTIQETKASNEDIENGLKRNAKTAAKVAVTFAELAVAQHIFGAVFESIAGYNPAFDIIDVIIKACGFDDDEESEDTALDNIEQGFLALLEDMPYTSTFTGGRIPISSALPIKELVTGEDEYGNEVSRLKTLGEVAPYYLLPTGYGQIKKTAQGLSMFSDEHPVAGSYTESGNLRFPVEDTLGNRIQAGIFGQWASENAGYYFDNDIAPLKEKQIEEYVDSDMPIKEYWKYRKNLSKYDSLAEKADYINSLDLTDEQKNLLINNIADRKEPIDMSNYDDFDSFEEFDFAAKNPEKYTFFKENGISYEDYKNADEDGKRAYSWAYENPEGYKVAQAISDDFLTYYKYKGDLYDIRADKDSNGDTIVGSAKDKKAEYINGLDLDYGQKIILFKSLYKADDTYNYDIVSYLNGRDDISYDEMVTILKELGFTVDSRGNVYWD